MESEFEAAVKRIEEETGIPHDELMARIRQKQRELIVTSEGAAEMVRKELAKEMGAK